MDNRPTYNARYNHEERSSNTNDQNHKIRHPEKEIVLVKNPNTQSIKSNRRTIDIKNRGAFNLDFYTDVEDLSYLQNHLDQDPRSAKYRKLTKELCEVIEDYGLVNFSTLAIQDKESVTNLVKFIDRTNGYIFQGIDASAVEFKGRRSSLEIRGTH
ncbi:P-loop containing nucleoside triphosphate hydrolases superfamily protein [Artemisia annua]|uniref:GPN-loop GTPase 2 n=1 Tax=Artemisia annua TaxID=35608 RepID=A0A2U1M5H2_ARTAN|nr:P-loop containing nucleoside triphosphate hydrolases superfamily protein [Artemisia annua]